MVTWVVEKDVFSEDTFIKMIKYFKLSKIPYYIISIIPFVHEIDGKIPKVDNPCVVYGSIGIELVAKQNNWIPGFWKNDNFNEELTRLKLKDLYFNKDAIIMPFSNVSNKIRELKLDEFFIKPNDDSKEFAGEVLSASEFELWLNNLLDINYLDNIDFDVVISSAKGVGREWRCVVINKKVVASSLYRNFRKLYQKEGVPKEVIDIAEKAANIFSPADVFIADVIESDDGLKILEYGCFNSAGLYKCNIENIIDEINKFAVEKYRGE